MLRAIEEKTIDRIGGRASIPVDVRVVAATNKDLRAAAESGEFRRDLFFRLAVFPVEIPPLRERGLDVLLLARHFAAQMGREMRGRNLLDRPCREMILEACTDELLAPIIDGEYYRNVKLSPELEEAAAKVQEEVSAAYEEAERALELLRHEGETEELAAE